MFYHLAVESSSSVNSAAVAGGSVGGIGGVILIFVIAVCIMLRSVKYHKKIRRDSNTMIELKPTTMFRNTDANDYVVEPPPRLVTEVDRQICKWISLKVNCSGKITCAQKKAYWS